MKILKICAGILVLAIGAFFIAANLPPTEHKFQCQGELTSEGKSKSFNLSFKLNEFQQAARMLKRSHGEMVLEVPGQAPQLYVRVVKAREEWLVYDDNSKVQGSYSAQRKTVAINTPTGFFDGSCTGQ